jgi:hypothetical protein
MLHELQEISRKDNRKARHTRHKMEKGYQEGLKIKMK